MPSDDVFFVSFCISVFLDNVSKKKKKIKRGAFYLILFFIWGAFFIRFFVFFTELVSLNVWASIATKPEGYLKALKYLFI